MKIKSLIIEEVFYYEEISTTREKLNVNIEEYEKEYNYIRSHGSLRNKPPMEHFNLIQSKIQVCC